MNHYQIISGTKTYIVPKAELSQVDSKTGGESSSASNAITKQSHETTEPLDFGKTVAVQLHLMSKGERRASLQFQQLSASEDEENNHALLEDVRFTVEPRTTFTCQNEKQNEMKKSSSKYILSPRQLMKIVEEPKGEVKTEKLFRARTQRAAQTTMNL